MSDDSTETSTERRDLSEDDLERRWDAAGEDPDLFDDLEYELEKLDVLVTSNSDKKVMVLPRAEEWVEDDAYIIADYELACDPIERA